MQITAEIPEIATNITVWQVLVKLKDIYTCQECGYTDRVNDTLLHSHHISKEYEASLIVSNGRCLCQDCHMHLHQHTLYASDIADKLHMPVESIIELIESNLLKAHKSLTNKQWIVKSKDLRQSSHLVESRIFRI